MWVWWQHSKNYLFPISNVLLWDKSFHFNALFLEWLASKGGRGRKTRTIDTNNLYKRNTLQSIFLKNTLCDRGHQSKQTISNLFIYTSPFISLNVQNSTANF